MSRVCLVTLRRYLPTLSRCIGYEFEDVVTAIDDVDVIVVEPTGAANMMHKALNRVPGVGGLAKINPGLKRVRLERDYDLLFMLVQFDDDVVAINSVVDWRKRSKTAICWLEEIWPHEVHRRRVPFRLLSEFDFVFANCHGTLDRLADSIGGHCAYVPPAVDQLRFCPYPQEPGRSIDVMNIGRRSAVTHAALLDWAAREGRFYYYDTIKKNTVKDPAEHRMLLASMLKRCQFFVANWAKFADVSNPDAQHELGFRFFEGAAGGAVLIGDPPVGKAFDEFFGWTDSVIPMPYDCADAHDVIHELLRQEDRLANIRRRNVAQSLRRHDIAHRWARVLEKAKLSPTEAMQSRLRRLEQLATRAEQNLVGSLA